jgi:hypothetical protein
MAVVCNGVPLNPRTALKDHSGERYGRLTIVEFDRYSKPSKSNYWKCKCDCGNYISISFSSIKAGHTKSCGCLRRDTCIKLHTTHKMVGTPTYKIWAAIRARCYSVNSSAYRYYGGRGIIMSDEWYSSFENFYSDMGDRPSDKYSIDRIDNNGPYSRENCRWATDIEQNNNTSCNYYITYRGKTQSMANWARELNIPYASFRGKIYRGAPIEKILSEIL